MLQMKNFKRICYYDEIGIHKGLKNPRFDYRASSSLASSTTWAGTENRQTRWSVKPLPPGTVGSAPTLPTRRERSIKMSYRRSQQEKKKLKKLYEETKTSYGSGAYFDKDKKRYIRYTSCSAPVRKQYKRQNVRNFRRNKVKVPARGCKYKRFYDFWWNIT